MPVLRHACVAQPLVHLNPPLRVVLCCERAKDIRLAEVAPPELQNSFTADRHPAIPSPLN